MVTAPVCHQVGLYFTIGQQLVQIGHRFFAYERKNLLNAIDQCLVLLQQVLPMGGNSFQAFFMNYGTGKIFIRKHFTHTAECLCSAMALWSLGELTCAP